MGIRGEEMKMGKLIKEILLWVFEGIVILLLISGVIVVTGIVARLCYELARPLWQVGWDIFVN
jgi:hypothetical protein